MQSSVSGVFDGGSNNRKSDVRRRQTGVVAVVSVGPQGGVTTN